MRDYKFRHGIFHDSVVPKERTHGLPEYYDYRDTGCELHPACLSCPLPFCQYDRLPDVARADERRLEARELRAHGLRYPEIAAMMGVTERTVFRALARAR